MALYFCSVVWHCIMALYCISLTRSRVPWPAWETPTFICRPPDTQTVWSNIGGAPHREKGLKMGRVFHHQITLHQVRVDSAPRPCWTLLHGVRPGSVSGLAHVVNWLLFYGYLKSFDVFETPIHKRDWMNRNKTFFSTEPHFLSVFKNFTWKDLKRLNLHSEILKCSCL